MTRSEATEISNLFSLELQHKKQSSALLSNSVVRNHMEEEDQFNLWRLVSDAQRTEEKFVGQGGLTLLPLFYAEPLRALLKRGSTQFTWFIKFHTSINQQAHLQGKWNRSRPRKKVTGLDTEYSASSKLQKVLPQFSLHMENCACRRAYPFILFFCKYGVPCLCVRENKFGTKKKKSQTTNPLVSAWDVLGSVVICSSPGARHSFLEWSRRK